MDQVNELAKTFIRAYYPIMTYSPSEVYHFYDPNAYIWRPSFGTTEGKNLQECRKDLPIPLEPTDILSISTYVVIPFSNNISLSVTGYITTPQAITAFVHDFIITQNYQKFFVISDSFHLFVPEKILEQSKNNVLIPNTVNQKFDYMQPAEPQFSVQPAPFAQPEAQNIDESDDHHSQQVQQQQQIQEKRENENDKGQTQHQSNYYHSNKHYSKYYQGPVPQGVKQPNPTFYKQRPNSYNSKK